MEKQVFTKPKNRGVYILPNMFTAGSMFSAFLGLIFASSGDFNSCSIAILISALLDGMDGKIARLTNSASDFGVQFDSLADVVAFGVTPAFMVYQWLLCDMGRLGIAVSFIFMACGALRLARFNVMANIGGSKKFFTGLPIPAAGCALACLVLFKDYLPHQINPVLPWFTLILTFCLGFLMVSRVRYFSFKEYGFLRTHPFRSLVGVILIFGLIITEPKILGFTFFIGYLLSGPIYTFFFMRRRISISSEQGTDK